MEGLAGCGYNCDSTVGSGIEVCASKARVQSNGEMLIRKEARDSSKQIAEPPKVENYVCVLQKCRQKKNLAEARSAYMQILKNGLESHKILGDYLVPTFVECASISDAQEVFNRLIQRNEYAWTSLIQGYIQCGETQHALNLFLRMQQDRVHPSSHTFVALLKGCTKLKYIERGREIHIEVAKQGYEREPFVGNTLVCMYTKCASLVEAESVFDRLPCQDVVSWTALMAGYADHGFDEKALYCFEQMQLEGVVPNAVTSICGLKTCATIGDIETGRGIHEEVVKKGFEREPLVGSTLVDMYGKCGSLAEARAVLDKLPFQDVVSWNALIAGYADHGLNEDALNCLKWMQWKGVSPDAITFFGTLKACCSIGDIDRCREIHDKIAKGGFERDSFVGSILVVMYAKYGSLGEAQQVFDKLPVRDVVLWSALIAGYAEQGLGEEALNCLELMHQEGVVADAITFIASLKACGITGATDRGQEIYAEITKAGFEGDVFVSNTLVDMYAKCGCLAEACKLFDQLAAPGLVSWNALIAGYARQGKSDLVFLLFERMNNEGIQPDEVTFLNVLIVCSHAGLLDTGQKYFEAMGIQYGITPTIKHHNCMVDLFGRAGQLEKAVMVLETMPFQPDLVTWSTMLGACRKCGNVGLGRQTFDCLLRLDENFAAACILMSNIYADFHTWDDLTCNQAI